MATIATTAITKVATTGSTGVVGTTEGGAPERLRPQVRPVRLLHQDM